MIYDAALQFRRFSRAGAWPCRATRRLFAERRVPLSGAPVFIRPQVVNKPEA